MTEETEKSMTFGEFIKKKTFIIPDYQRAYSWGEKQLIPFIKDILEHCDDNDNPSDDTRYYLGHYILEKPEKSISFEIVDGQQRISTVYLFLMVCGNLKEKNYINGINFSPVSYDSDGLEQIKTILYQNVKVDDELNNLLIHSKTSSLKRMIEAVVLFKKVFKDTEKTKLSLDDIDNYVEIISNAYCSVAIFKDKSVASQIFELHNTRGVKLTETEKVKAVLMKNIYINSSKPDTDIEIIQKKFASIFEFEEKANQVWLRGEMSLDTILMYHLRAIEDGNKIENFSFPISVEGERGSFEYVKESLSKKNGKQAIVEYVKNFAKEFARTMEIITVDIPNVDKQENNHLIGDILLLDRSKSLIFLLRFFRSSKQIDYKLIERWENFVLCYDIIYWNGFFHRTQYRGNFDLIYASLKPDFGFEECNNLLKEYYNGKWFGSGWGHLGENTKKLFAEGKNKWLSHTYGWTRAGYFLYKYEIQNGAEHKNIRQNIFKGDTVSIDHIVARGIEWKDLGFENYQENKNQADELWGEINGVINGIGNLSLSTTSANSSDSNGLPYKHIETYEKMGLVKTVEQVKSWVIPEQFTSEINRRSEDVISFIYEKVVNRNDIWE
ncbi:hypothetical protein HNQ02_000360 [Flavobacterium sp. 7E]|uniref:DUF262 domain-containing protein n=1 Tax=Flavobacterium sp. 7E TaxID=2735898 RepID=UPI00156F5231|nr:DUF262 domain-containing protein [Flavobacterium sp. 7E]NRS87460.1 hypothetical protein [Flavobacterium sp. 7E]